MTVECVCTKEIADYELGRALRDPTLQADKWIVVTTIRSPTDAVRALAQQSGWKVVVVGDKKTPKTWRYISFSCLFYTVVTCPHKYDAIDNAPRTGVSPFCK